MLAGLLENRWMRRARYALLLLVLALGIAKLVMATNEHYPFTEWLVWRYSTYFLWSAVFSVACLSVGHRIQKLLFRRVAPIGEHVAVSMALGVVVFYLGIFLFGLAHLLHWSFALAFPAALTVSGAWPLLRYARRLVRHVRYWRRKGPRAKPLWRIPLHGLGVLAVVMLWFNTIHPENVAYDARWYHLPLAEHYAALGAITRFPEGWFPGTGPHLASVLYTWAFLLPHTAVFDHIMQAATLELTLFLFTLAAIPALVRRLLPGTRAPLSWAVMFLFPGVMLYDSSLCSGADHVAGFFAIPTYLALMRAWKEFTPARAGVLAALISAALLTKYTAATVAVFPIAAALLRGAYLLARSLLARRLRLTIERPARIAAGIGTFALVGLGVTATHWLKNWLWYGDPVYPVLYQHFAVRPWTPDTAFFYRSQLVDNMWVPTGPLRKELWETVKVLFTFAFEPHDWGAFHGKVPVFGFLFTLLVFALPFLKGGKRIWGVVVSSWVGIALWFWVHHEDRYLQALVPWMVASTAAIIILAWRSGLLARGLVIFIAALQGIWGSDVYFIPTHTMIHTAPVKYAADMVATGYQKKYKERLHPYGGLYDVGRDLPKGSVVLVHELHPHTGLRSASVNDWPGFQGGISYGQYPTLKAAHDALKGMGITHLLWWAGNSRGVDSIAGDLAFYGVAFRLCEDPKKYPGLVLCRLPDEAPRDELSELVLYLGCTGYQPGLYDRKAMRVPGAGQHADAEYPPPRTPLDDAKGNTIAALIGRAGFVVSDPTCHRVPPKGLFDGLQMAAKRGKQELWVRVPAPSNKQLP